MEFLDVISVNIWQILISLCNLIIIFLIFKKLLFAPVKKAVKTRQDNLDAKYSDAEEAKRDAESQREEWKQKLNFAKDEAEKIIAEANIDAKNSAERIVAVADERAEAIIKAAKEEAEREKKQAFFEAKHDIADISARIAEKMIGKQIDEKNQHEIINSFIDEIGENDDGKN